MKRTLPIFTNADVLIVANMTPPQLQCLLRTKAIVPLDRGRRGPGGQRRFSFVQAVSIAHAAEFRRVGYPWALALGAAAWFGEQSTSNLLQAFVEGRTLNDLRWPDLSYSRLVVPFLKPGADSEKRLAVARLNLERTFARVLKRALELAESDKVETRTAETA
jgi:hypothetical protein